MWEDAREALVKLVKEDKIKVRILQPVSNLDIIQKCIFSIKFVHFEQSFISIKESFSRNNYRFDPRILFLKVTDFMRKMKRILWYDY